MMAKRIGWIGVVVLAALATASQAATHTWDGGAADDFWRSAANWVGDVAPTNGDSVALGATGDIRLDTAFTIENGQSLTDTGAGFNPELILEGSNAVLTLAGDRLYELASALPYNPAHPEFAEAAARRLIAMIEQNREPPQSKTQNKT